ncbi:MAG: ABC transporter ATP-binding protein [Pseudomonadota bacterium]
MSLEFRRIRHHYGDFQALEDIEMTAADGEITCLLGASGCGKTTLLQLAAGLQPVQAGEIYINNQLLADSQNNPAPENRPVGMVFQDGALFPHMTIAENIGFGLKQKADAAQIVAQWLDQIGLVGMEQRYPHMLSGGQQQRVALARAMASTPDILLMDEPFANIDVVLRRQIREDTRRLLKERGATVILVTHDPEEAMEIADRIAVMDSGRIVQIGSADVLYDAPRTLAVGLLLGGGQSLEAVQGVDGISTEFGNWPISSLANDWPKNAGAMLLVRPDSLSIKVSSQGHAIIDIRRKGNAKKYVIATSSGEKLSVFAPLSEEFELGERVAVTPNDGTILAYPK